MNWVSVSGDISNRKSQHLHQRPRGRQRLISGMNCLPCFSNDDDDEGNDQTAAPTKKDTPSPSQDAAASSNAQAFTFRELAMATKNFRQECLLGEGGFGRVFKGKLQSTSQVVAVKQLDRNGMQGNKEFLVEVLILGLLQHPNLVSLIGYCADGDQRLLVYEFMPMGSLENHLFGDDPEKKPMDWYTRMKVASGAAKGLEYLHDKANPPIIYRDLKPSNILLDESYEPKLSDFGLAKLGAGGGKMHPTSRVMGTYGYSAPEYSSSGELTLKSDIYSFGVVLLELITGRRGIDTNRSNEEQNLVTWAQPFFRERKRFPELADPLLSKEFPETGLNQAVGICAMCLQEEPSVRPLIGDVVAALCFLSIPQPNAIPTSVAAGEKSLKDDAVNAFTPPPEQKMQYTNEVNQNQTTQTDKDKESSDHDDGSSEYSEDEESDRESSAEQPNEGSCQNSVTDSYNTAEGGNHSGRESGRYSDKEESSYSDSDTMDDSDHNASNSRKLEVGSLSSNHGSSRRSSSTKKTGSRRRKMVVTFKEPNLSSKRNWSKKVLGVENSCQSQLVGTEQLRQESSSSSSESSSESEDEKECSRKGDKLSSSDENANPEPTNNIDMNEGHRVFDKYGPEAPKLRHLQTR